MSKIFKTKQILYIWGLLFLFNTIFAINLPDSTKEWQEFQQVHSFKKIYLVYAGPYPSSPSSAFGHLLLLLEPDTSDEKPILLWDAINYGANVQGLNSFEQFYKGIYGSLKGKFSIVPFYEKLRDYTYIESRQLWLLPLELNIQESELFLYNLYLLHDKEFQYRFHDMNCASQIEFLINKSLNKNEPKRLFVSPRSVISNLEERLSKPLFFESTENILNKSLGGSDSVDSSNVNFLLNVLEWKYFKRKMHLSEKEQNLLKKLRVSVAQNSGSNDSHFRHQFRDLKIHSPAKFGLGLILNRNKNLYYDFMFRLGLHDFNDDFDVFSRYDNLNLLKFRINFNKNSILLKELWLFDQSSITPDTYFSKPVSWKLSLGTERKSYNYQQVLISGIFTSFGKTYSLISENISVSLLIDLNAVNIENTGNSILAGPELLLNFYLSGNSRINIRYEFYMDIFARDIQLNSLIRFNFVSHISRFYHINIMGDFTQKYYNIGLTISRYIN